MGKLNHTGSSAVSSGPYNKQIKYMRHYANNRRTHGTLTALLIGLCLLLSAAQPAWTGETTKEPQVALYVLPNCGYCERARHHLQARGTAFVEYDIAANPAHELRFKALGGQGTPLIDVGGRIVHGYDAARLDAALAQLNP